MYVKRLLVLSLFLAVAATLFWLGKDTLGRQLGSTELAIASLVGVVLVLRWLFAVRRRQRQKVEEMRDSALW
jgi:cytochrome bd-type quinol oxidase subunit 2